MTHAEMASIDQRFDSLSAQIKALSGQIEEMKRTMVTREEYNKAHAPLVRMVTEDHELVKKHEGWYQNFARGRNKLAWIGLAVLLFSIWAAPHWQGITRLFVELAR
jgi:hypothetical protein